MRRMKYFQGKTVWLTGASGGIGAALATAFARDGANLILSGRNTDKIEALGSTLAGTFPGEYKTLFLDLAHTDDHVETARKARSLLEASTCSSTMPESASAVCFTKRRMK